MFDLLLCMYFGYKASVLARRKGQNITLWVIVSILCFVFCMAAGAFALILMFYNGAMTPDGMQEFMMQPLRRTFIYVCGVGGYLLVKYLLERMPDMPVNKTNGE